MPTKPFTPAPRIMMISLHGYVAAQAEIGLPDTGGQVVYVLELSKHLARLGYEVDIFTRRFESQPEIERVGAGVRIVRIPAGGEGLIRKEWMCDVVPEWISAAATWIRQQGLRYRVVVSHYWDAGLAGDALGGALGIAHVHTPHSLGSWKRASMGGDPVELERQYNFERRIHDEGAIMRNAARVIATSPQQRQLIAGLDYGVDPGRIAVIPPGFDPGRFHPVARDAREALRRVRGVHGPTVLALGRVAANKGYDLLTRAMAVVLRSVPEARLVLAVGSTHPTPGEAAQISELRDLADELGIAHAVEILDYIPDAELADTYRAADLFVLSSRYEPFGMTAVEAMACGTPVVVTTKGGLWELLEAGRDALCADPNDSEAFGTAMARVLAEPGLAQRLAGAGAERARRSFTWEAVARALVSALGLEPASAPSAATWRQLGARRPIGAVPERSW